MLARAACSLCTQSACKQSTQHAHTNNKCGVGGGEATCVDPQKIDAAFFFALLFPLQRMFAREKKATQRADIFLVQTRIGLHDCNPIVQSFLSLCMATAALHLHLHLQHGSDTRA